VADPRAYAPTDRDIITDQSHIPRTWCGLLDAGVDQCQRQVCSAGGPPEQVSPHDADFGSREAKSSAAGRVVALQRAPVNCGHACRGVDDGRGDIHAVAEVAGCAARRGVRDSMLLHADKCDEA
jgi:hypothetical protein